MCFTCTGNRPASDWAAKYLKTSADRDKVENVTDFWSLYNISATLPQQRLDDLIEAAIFPNTLTASPGQIHAANDQVVEHTASVIPGISGGAGGPCSHASMPNLHCFMLVVMLLDLQHEFPAECRC